MANITSLIVNGSLVPSSIDFWLIRALFAWSWKPANGVILMTGHHQKPPPNPTHSTRSTPTIYPKALLDTVGVDRVDYVGYIWVFSPEVDPISHQFQQIGCPRILRGI
jgi:hypothetical protein